MLADDIGFTTDDEVIAQRAAETPAKVDRLLSSSQSILAEINSMMSAQFSLGVPDDSELPPVDVEAARDLGFEALSFVHWGHWPLPLMRTANWIGPEGFVKLESYRGSRRYLNTYLDNGVSISTPPQGTEGGNIRTIYLEPKADLREAYRAHLEAVKEYCDESDARPLYRPTPELVVECWKLFGYLHTPPAQGLMMMCVTWSIPIALAFMLKNLFF